MSESNQHYRITSLIQEIIEACKNDPARLDVATANFESLIKVMKLYERASRYFNGMIEEADEIYDVNQHAYIQAEKPPDPNDSSQFPVVLELEKIYGHQLKQCELQKLGSALSLKTGLKILRDVRRNKVLLLQWFSQNWDQLKPAMYEAKLQKEKEQAQNEEQKHQEEQNYQNNSLKITTETLFNSVSEDLTNNEHIQHF